MPDSPFLTVNQVVAYLTLSRSQIMRLIDQGKLRCLRSGRAIRVLRESVDQYVREQTGTTPHGAA